MSNIRYGGNIPSTTIIISSITPAAPVGKSVFPHQTKNVVLSGGILTNEGEEVNIELRGNNEQSNIVPPIGEEAPSSQQSE